MPSREFWDRHPILHSLYRLPARQRGESPFAGDYQPGRVSLLSSDPQRPSAPFPHFGNYHEPLRILETFFYRTENERGAARHSRYLDIPGFAPVLVTRDPQLIRLVATETGDGAGMFERDTLPTTGIAKATGADTLLYSNGPIWRRQRKVSASPFGKTTLFQPEIFGEFADTFRATISERLTALREHLRATGQTSLLIALEPEVKALMLEMLTNNFFGTTIPLAELREVYIPSIDRVIRQIVRDTIWNKIGITLWKLHPWTPGLRQARRDHEVFNRLTELVLASRKRGSGLWRQFKSDAPDEALRSNIQVFLAGALEATSSFACWALTHLARNQAAQTAVFEEVRRIDNYTPETLESASYLGQVLEETLRLTPALYFLPRRAPQTIELTLPDGRCLTIPGGTHVLLDVWHANRCEDFWGVTTCGFPALQFAPERWSPAHVAGRGSKERLHFGFGHGPRVCPGKHLGLLETALLVGATVKLFNIEATESNYHVSAGVSTKPADGTLVKLRIRE